MIMVSYYEEQHGKTRQLGHECSGSNQPLSEWIKGTQNLTLLLGQEPIQIIDMRKSLLLLSAK